MTLPFVRARWQKNLPETELKPFVQKPENTLVHELRLVVRHSNQARQISPYVLCRGSLCVFTLLRGLDAVTLARPSQFHECWSHVTSMISTGTQVTVR